MLDEESLGLRYLEVYGDFAYYLHITEKKIVCLNQFKYLSPEEYNKFKVNLNKYYIGTKISWILNNKLRTGQKLRDEEIKLSNVLKNVYQSNKCQDYIILRRYVDLNFLA